MLTRENFYRCYDGRLTKYLMSKGHPYLLIAIDVVTSRKFWLFEKSDILLKYINEWERLSPIK